MSVAFRRESDEEHREPSFELPIPVGPNLVTADGEALIADRIAVLERQLADAGDVAAPAIRRDLRYWHTRRTTAIRADPPTDGTIGIGSRVEMMLLGKRRTITLVGDDEADPAKGRIAFTAPIARAILGAETGDILAFNGRDEGIEIVAVG